MRVTIISDASVDFHGQRGAYAFWAVSQRGRHAGQGVFKVACSNPNEAETMAVVNALHTAINLGIAAAGDQVLVQTDSLHAIRVFSGYSLRPKVLKKYASMMQALREIVARHNLTMEYRHVKGHSKETDARSRAQQMTDKRARKAMRAAKKQATP